MTNPNKTLKDFLYFIENSEEIKKNHFKKLLNKLNKPLFKGIN